MRIWHVTAALAAALVMTVPEGLDSCGIAPPSPVFATKRRPADLRNQFLKGKVGVLQRSYQQRYLIGTFRILSGVPLTDAEAGSLYPAPSARQDPPSVEPGLDGWRKTHGAVPGLGVYKTVTLDGLLYSFENCHKDAFIKATATLANLSAKWGERDPRTLDWVRAQDQVFANCSGKDAVIPAPPEAGADPLLAAHRRYQIAAALFYSGQFRKASEAFRQIAEEKDSPWRPWAPYLTARALMRAGQFDGDREANREAKDRLLEILKDPAQSDRREDCLRLLHLWQLRVEPRARLEELSAQLMQPSEKDVSQSVIDFLYVVNDRQGATVETTSELAAWMLVMSERPPAESGERAVEWWRKTRKPAWLIAALANAGEKDLPELLVAAGAVPAGAPAFESVAYYATSREVARGRNDDARQLADRALSGNLQRSSRNLILALRTRLARDWNEFLRFSLRRPEPRIEESEGAEVETNAAPIPSGTAPVFDLDVIGDFNARVPLSLWVDAAANPILPPYMQIRIAQAGWLRAVLLGRDEDARKLMRRVAELRPPASEVARGFLTAGDAEESRFAAVYLVLRTPSLSPSLPLPESRTLDFAETHYVDVGCRSCWTMEQRSQVPPATLDFLTPAQRAEGEAEWKRIRAAEPWQATYLTRETLDWARKHPDDPRVPEALHRAVMASRYRATDAETGKYSRQAFALLHQRYAKSEWAEKTKYWYK